MLRFVHYSDVTWAKHAVSIQWQLDCLYNSSFGLMSNETSMVQYGEFFCFLLFFFTDSCLLLVLFYQSFPLTPTHTTPQPPPPIPPPPPIIMELWTSIHGLYHFSLRKGNIKGTHYWPFMSEFHRWIPPTKGQQCGKCFNFMMPSWAMRYDYDNHMILRPYYFYYRGFNDYWTSWICIYTLNIH